MRDPPNRDSHSPPWKRLRQDDKVGDVQMDDMVPQAGNLGEPSDPQSGMFLATSESG